MAVSTKNEVNPETLSTSQIIALGIQMAGPIREDESVDKYRSRILVAAKLASMLVSPSAPEYKRIDQLRSAIPLRGVITAFGKHPNNPLRGQITFQGDGRDEPEDFSTLIQSDPDGRAMIRQLRGAGGNALVGHRVILFKINEPDKTGKASHGFRTAVHIEDLGPAD